ncbi:methyl-accepting chemotaxis protein [Herbaspirillum sp. CF444]|uniref:methyl-accepting chemotaxis protein n=1 Tax=Herbaspirillum sp. CF444 TaxID=1144319 RepID=UPI0002722D60|nr:methyl-accepting chemotaxis protein [Herbaspirillum sp. CF444]EJL90913.1 methyl-accepting chemotaxis protein [Herbaspirillum sp. CF444]
MNLRRFSIGVRLSGGFALLFVLLAALGGVIAMQAASLQNGLSQQLMQIAATVPAAQQKAIATALADADGARQVLLKFAALTGIALVLACGLIAWRLSRSITRPLQAAVSVARRVATGDLSSKVVVEGRDEVSDLLRALQAMNQSLLDIVGEVRSSTQVISEASGQIAAGNGELSARTEAQASSLEQTASSMEQLTSAVTQNADHTARANQMVEAASSFAVKGGQVVSQVLETMSSINDSSRKIVEIISVIDGIAFQTNILALNASVEAARAGEQGRGFAVVAAEVRNLAQRSAVAAKEIKSLIDDSVQKVQSGNALADQAGGTMREIVESVQHVERIIAEITQAGKEQSGGITEVNQAITQMDRMTQQNAAMVEQAASAAVRMQQLATSLAQSVSAFRLENHTEEAVAMVRRAVQHVKQQGKEAALADFSRPAPEFKQRDLYINVIDLNGNTLAHGENAKLIGRNLIDLKDADGKLFIKQFVDTARSAGKGWIDYRWPNPVTAVLEEKTTYIEEVGGFVIGCGIYKG